MKKYVIIVALILLAGAVVVILPPKPDYESKSGTEAIQDEYYYNEEENEDDSLLPDDLSSILNENTTVPLDTNPASVTVLVNRSYPLASYYVPSDLTEPKINFSFSYQHEKRKLRKEAANALEDLFRAAAKKNVILYGVSGYRSYVRQKQIYDNNVRTRGVLATNSVSAKPGSSEHQSGLAIDVSAKSVGCRLDQALGNTTEGRWLAKNAHRFGYIIRYPKGKEFITGYSYEPWHIRYVGKDVATYLYKNDLTLEEYYGTSCDIKSGENLTGVDVENADTVSYSTPEPTKKSKATATPKATKKPKRTPKPTKKPTKKPKQTQAPTAKPTQEPAATAVPTVAPTQAPPEVTPESPQSNQVTQP